MRSPVVAESDFVAAWNSSSSPDEAAARIGMTTASASARASKIRRAGGNRLKDFRTSRPKPHTPEVVPTPRVERNGPKVNLNPWGTPDPLARPIVGLDRIKRDRRVELQEISRLIDSSLDATRNTIARLNFLGKRVKEMEAKI